MGNFGFLALGASTILLASTVLERTQGSRDRGIIMLALLPLLGAGTAILLIPSLLNSKSVDYFPIGMLLATCWLGLDPSLRSLSASNMLQRSITIIKLLLTCAVTVLLLRPVFA